MNKNINKNNEALHKINEVLSDLQFGEVKIKVVNGSVIMIERNEQYKIQDRKGGKK